MAGRPWIDDDTDENPKIREQRANDAESRFARERAKIDDESIHFISPTGGGGLDMYEGGTPDASSINATAASVHSLCRTPTRTLPYPHPDQAQTCE